MLRIDPKTRSDIHLVDGIRVHSRMAGSGRPIVLLHGLVGSSSNWQYNIASLARHASVYAPDLVNMGASERVPELDASLAATADRIARYMDALGLAEADIVGHSHGGASAMMLAARHPHRVRSLILCAPANPFCDLGHQLIDFYQTGIGRSFAKLVPVLPEALKAIALRRMYGDPRRVAPDALAGYTDGLRRPGTVDHILQILRHWKSDMRRLRSALPSLAHIPTLLLWGDRDRAVGLASGQELARQLPNSQLVVLPGAGHIPFEELPDLCNSLMATWLRNALAPVPGRIEPASHCLDHALSTSESAA